MSSSGEPSNDSMMLFGSEHRDSDGDGVADSSDSVALLAAVRRGRASQRVGLDGKQQELMGAVATLKKENKKLHDEVAALRAREVEMASLAMQLQQQWTQTQNQISNIKLTLHAQLQSPITDEEYFALEQRKESDRDIVDIIKLGIYQHLGELKSSRDAAIRRGCELAEQVGQAEQKVASTEERLKDKTAQFKNEREVLNAQIEELQIKVGSLAIMETKLADAEHRLETVRHDREQLFETKLQLKGKESEAMRLEHIVKELEDKLQAARDDAECAEQKLDVLKGEYYDSKLQYGQRIMDLESQLRNADEKINMLRDLELEAEVFMNNMAGAHGVAADGSALALPFDVPQSRRLQHSLSVTKRALVLENQLVAIKHELEMANKKNQRLSDSLKMAQSALSDSNSPYALVEDALKSKDDEIQRLNDRITSLDAENASLRDNIAALTSDVSALTSQRRELAHLKAALMQGGSMPSITNSKRQESPKRVASAVERRPISGVHLSSPQQPRGSAGAPPLLSDDLNSSLEHNQHRHPDVYVPNDEGIIIC